jgi:hypothetical protein
VDELNADMSFSFKRETPCFQHGENVIRKKGGGIMKEKMQFIGLLAGVCVFLLAVLLSNILGVKKTSVKASAQVYVIISDGACMLVDGNGVQQMLPPGNPVKFHQVITKDDEGNVNATCKGDVEPSKTKKSAVHWNFENTGYTCFIGGQYPGLPTTDWQEVVTPKGNATLICQYHVNQGGLLE